MSEANEELHQTQARLARLLERDARYFEAETLLRGIWGEPMSPSNRYEVGRTFARVLRLRNKWDELDAVLGALIAAAQDREDTEQIAQLLVLRMEADLCAYPNHPESCIETADLLLSISQDPALVFRALGHKGLAYLALGDVPSARRFLDEGVAAGERSGDPEAIFLTLHFSSQLAIAILELPSAIEIGHRLVKLSEEYAIARDELFHLRDLSRAELLAGTVEDGAAHLAAYLLANKRSYERERALSYAVLMVVEAMSLTDEQTVGSFLDRLKVEVAKRPDDATPSDQALVDAVDWLTGTVVAGRELDPLDFVKDEAAIEASWRIFCFNSDRLEQTRDEVRTGQPTAPVVPAVVGETRPALIVDLHGALGYFTDSFAPLGAAELGSLPAEDVAALRRLATRFDILVTRKAPPRGGR